jgi:hypothetical protein
MEKPEKDISLVSRRRVATAAMLGGASLFLGEPSFAGQPSPASPGDKFFIDVRRFGAAGDGKTDDTGALQRALDAAGETTGSVFLPPGVYVTGELHVRAKTSLIGLPSWDYHFAGGSTLQLASAQASCLLNLTEAFGATIQGLALDGRDLGSGIHGMAMHRQKWADNEDCFRIQGCQVTHFTGNGLHMECAWCFSVRHSMIAYNHGDGLYLRGWDAFILDNWLSGNHGAGYAGRLENASVTFTANRVEWNGQENMLLAGGDGYQITGNFFDRAGTCGIALRKRTGPCSQISISGNYIKRSGKLAGASEFDSAHLLLDGAQGVTCVGNTLQAMRDDGGGGVWSPAFGIVYGGLRNAVIKDNVLHEGAIKQLMVDRGGNGDGVIVADNPGSLFTDLARTW